MWFNIYLTFMQYLQFTYQRGCLYRLRSLGERDDMDITIDGFHSWMWKGNLNYSIMMKVEEFHSVAGEIQYTFISEHEHSQRIFLVRPFEFMVNF